MLMRDHLVEPNKLKHGIEVNLDGEQQVARADLE
jgi:hypothetical protein